ncbi:MAG: hypothetical protein N2749_03440 [Clostridia bacterium]|nr:hypothetical protein [Clostridia bacterium]
MNEKGQIDEKQVYLLYIEGKLSIKEIAKKCHVNEGAVFAIAENYAKFVLEDVTELYAAKLKREKKEKEDKKRKEQEEKDKLNKEKNDQKQEQALDEARKYMHDYLESKDSKELFCAKTNRTLSYFRDTLDLLKNSDNKQDYKLYKDLEYKILHLEDDEGEKNTKAKICIESFLEHKKDIYDFCSENKYSRKYFYEMLDVVKNSDQNLYNFVKYKIVQDEIKKSSTIALTIKKMATYEIAGINSDGKNKKFDILDYYKMTNINIDKLIRAASDMKLDSEYESLKRFADSTRNDRTHITEHDIMSKRYVVHGILVENDIKQKIINYLEKNKIPFVNGTFKIALEKFVDSEIDISKSVLTDKSEKIVEATLKKEFSSKNVSEDIINESIIELTTAAPEHDMLKSDSN